MAAAGCRAAARGAAPTAGARWRGDDAAQRVARRRRAAPRSAADRAAVAGAVRDDTAPDAGLHTGQASVLAGAMLLGPGSTTRTASPSCCRATGPSCRCPPTPTGGVRHHAAARRRRPGARGGRRTAHRRDISRRPGRGRAGPGGERIPIARSQPRVIARARAGRAPLRRPPVRDRAARAELVTAVDGDALRELHATGCCRPGAPSCWSATSTPGRRGRRRRGARPGRAPGTPSRRRRARDCAPPGSSWSTGPARCSPTCGSAAPRRAHRSRPGRGPPGQHDLRRLLLLPAGREHPRAARLHLQPAQLGRPPGGRSSFLVEADVATEVTGPALLETWYELGRMALTPVTEAELDAARRYILGSMALSTATHAGLASTLSALVGAGLPADWLAEHQRPWPRSPSSRCRRRPAATWRGGTDRGRRRRRRTGRRPRCGARPGGGHRARPAA